MIWWVAGWAAGLIVSLVIVQYWTRDWARGIKDRGGSPREIKGVLRFGYLIACLTCFLSWVTVLAIIVYMNDVEKGLG